MTLEPRTCTQAELYRILTRQLAERMIAAGWLKPRVAVPTKQQGKTKKIYAVEDIRRCEDRILNGEYPEI